MHRYHEKRYAKALPRLSPSATRISLLYFAVLAYYTSLATLATQVGTDISPYKISYFPVKDPSKSVQPFQSLAEINRIPDRYGPNLKK